MFYICYSLDFILSLKSLIMKQITIDIKGKPTVISITEEQYAELVKENTLPTSWEEVFAKQLPEWYIDFDGEVFKYKCRIENSHTNVSSQARAKSLLAYCKLSVVVDYLNSVSEPSTELCFIEFCKGVDIFIITEYSSYLMNPLALNNKEVAKHLLKHFKDLLNDYFMI
jgi:hypothetical protein